MNLDMEAVNLDAEVVGHLYSPRYSSVGCEAVCRLDWPLLLLAGGLRLFLSREMVRSCS